MPAAPEPPAPISAPSPVISSTTPTTVKPTMSKRASLRQASQGTSSLNIPLGGTGGGGSTPSMTNLSIGK